MTAGKHVWSEKPIANSLAAGQELLVTPEQALHVLEIITAARESRETGSRIALRSTFKWPMPG